MLATPTRFLCALLVPGVLALGATAAPDLRLLEAAKSRDARAVEELLKEGVDVNARQPDGATALHWAVYWDDEETVGLLLTAGAEVNVRNELGATPLWIAAVEGRAAMVERLVAAGADPNMPLLMGETPLMAAARAGSAEAVTALLSTTVERLRERYEKADVNARERLRGQTALMWAAAEKHPEVVRVLVEHGAKVDARSDVRRMFWNTGADGGRDPESMVWMDDGGFTPLLFAARVGDIASAEILLAAGTDVDEPSAQGASPLAIAVFSGHTAFGEFLLSKGANPNAAGAGYAPLHAAVLRGDQRMVRALLSHGATPDVRLQSGTGYGRGANDWFLSWHWIDATPFWIAARLSEYEIMGILAEGGADTHIVKRDGLNALMAPIANIPERGNRLGLRSPEEEKRDTPEAQFATVRTAIGFGVDVNAVDDDGNTALHLAAGRRLNPVVELLLERGANVNAKNKKGQTPLMIALERRPGGGGDDPAANDSSTADLLRKLGAKEEEQPEKPPVQ